MRPLNVLIACEESQAVCLAFRKRGHKAFSCDIQDCSGGHPEWHLKMDVFKALHIYPWDMMIGFPPCKFLAWSGERWQKPDQKFHPFHFGDPFRKTTCLWLRGGLKPLIPTNIIFRREPAAHNMWPSKDRDKLRAKTYPGIARAMAEQWSPDLGNIWDLPI